MSNWSRLVSASNTKHIWQAFFTNLGIALIKATAAVFTKSGAMLAEAIHSAADCSNQLLLLLGVKRAAKAPDADHPLGYGRSLYFWSFLVALLLFTAGGVFSIYEGLHKIWFPEQLHHLEIGLTILFIAFLLEGWSTLQNVKEMNLRRKTIPFLRYLRETKDSDLIVVFGENSAATAGLVLAMFATVCAWYTQDPRWDGVGSLMVGVVLVGVAIFLAIEIQSLLVGERADPAIEVDIRAALKGHETIIELLNLITVQQGPSEVMVAMKVRMKDELRTDEICHEINRFEKSLKLVRPEIRWCFVEPDTEK
ncbi:MAG: cation diffusion facilitator family transporter [Proteobacteria bacterium]|nr:MAG: cation diffusion facilitator family transporter [Pseudomonadota bacterium]